MDIKAYLREVLSQYPLNRIYIRAGIELQQLKNDGVIWHGECRYSRNDKGHRQGIEIIYKKDQKDNFTDTVEVVACGQNIKE